MHVVSEPHKQSIAIAQVCQCIHLNQSTFKRNSWTFLWMCK